MRITGFTSNCYPIKSLFIYLPWTFLPSDTRVATPRAPKSKKSKSVKIVSRKQNVDDQNQSGSEGKYNTQNFILFHKLKLL